jgi:polysaccharide export outer membrane protein
VIHGHGNREQGQHDETAAVSGRFLIMRSTLTFFNLTLRKCSLRRSYSAFLRHELIGAIHSNHIRVRNSQMTGLVQDHPAVTVRPRMGVMGVLILLTLTVTSACTLTPKNAGRNVINNVPHEYVIGAGDVLEILVWKNDALSKVVTVRPDGKISLPLVNDVQAAGLTPMELRGAISTELKKYKELPEVSVIVKETLSQVVYLMGQVTKPGPYPLGPNSTVIQVIAQAGGFTEFADRNNIIVLRRNPGSAKEQRIQVNYKSILAGRTVEGDITLKAGDTIIVP